MAEVNTTQMRDALAWATNDQKSSDDKSANVWEWFWQAVQGDFNDERSTGQIAMDAAISMIPLVDQICDVRDLIANCKKLYRDFADTWAWVALVLTLIGLIPVLGSLVKGVLKIFFVFVRRAGGDAVIKGVDAAMTWVVDLLRRREFQKYLSDHKVDEVFGWLAKQIRVIRSKVSTATLLVAFDKAIATLEKLADKVKYLPALNAKVMNSLKIVRDVRQHATSGMNAAVAKVDGIFDAIIKRLEHEALMKHHGIVNVKNVHFRGAIPEEKSIELIRDPKSRPVWISDGPGKKVPLTPNSQKIYIEKYVKNGWPRLQPHNIESFHTLEAVSIRGPKKLYRIIAPTSGGMGDCWVSEEIFKKLNAAPDPKAAWRQHLAVWPHWNCNGQFVVYDVKPGETLRAWRGAAASQMEPALANLSLDGGWEQIVFNVERSSGFNDTTRYYKVTAGNPDWVSSGIDYSTYSKMSNSQKKDYTSIREEINHPNISGPFETGWGYNDFNGSGFLGKVGLPSFAGQISHLAN